MVWPTVKLQTAPVPRTWMEMERLQLLTYSSSSVHLRRHVTDMVKSPISIFPLEGEMEGVINQNKASASECGGFFLWGTFREY